ncbi:MAG: selenium cofactor biosynthesis protein YqeC [Thermodesulfobacteriota bacterium]|nr:selenium cofactor biosynthesis protein YqeC [Thermodesulfobacteriota bacterium]
MNDEQKVSQKGSLSEALGLGTREMISLTGAGGKTTLMFRLAKDLILEGKKVITTTTTKILKPAAEESRHLFVAQDEEKIGEFINHHLDKYRHITLVGERLGAGKLKGILPGLLNNLWNSYEIDAMIIEADGAAGRPVKAPREAEPVIPSSTTLVVAILGVDGVEKELNDENVFQAERVSRLTGIPVGRKMTEEGMALLMVHPEGLFKGAPSTSKLIAFLNKVEILDGLIRANRIAQKIFEKGHPRIERVILGQLRSEPPVAEAIFS